MKVEIRQQGDVTYLTAIGELDAFHLPRLSDKLDAQLDEGRSKLVFNLRLTESIDSSSFGYLVKAKERARQAGGNLVLVQPSKFVTRSMEHLGLAEFFDFAESEEAAAIDLGE